MVCCDPARNGNASDRAWMDVRTPGPVGWSPRPTGLGAPGLRHQKSGQRSLRLHPGSAMAAHQCQVRRAATHHDSVACGGCGPWLGYWCWLAVHVPALFPSNLRLSSNRQRVSRHRIWIRPFALRCACCLIRPALLSIRPRRSMVLLPLDYGWSFDPDPLTT